MSDAIQALSRRVLPFAAAVSLGVASLLMPAPAQARGPDGIADVAEKVIDAVVNISTSQTVNAKNDDKGGATPQLPPDSPFWRMPQVIVTPHSAGETRAYEGNVIDILLDNLERLGRGETGLRNQIV